MAVCIKCGSNFSTFSGYQNYKGGKICIDCSNKLSKEQPTSESINENLKNSNDILPSFYVENRIRKNIIPLTKNIGIISGIIIGLGMIFSGQIITGILVALMYISGVFALVILLDGFAEIISLLRSISISLSDRKRDSHLDDVFENK